MPADPRKRPVPRPAWTGRTGRRQARMARSSSLAAGSRLRPAIPVRTRLAWP